MMVYTWFTFKMIHRLAGLKWEKIRNEGRFQIKFSSAGYLAKDRFQKHVFL